MTTHIAILDTHLENCVEVARRERRERRQVRDRLAQLAHVAGGERVERSRFIVRESVLVAWLAPGARASTSTGAAVRARGGRVGLLELAAPALELGEVREVWEPRERSRLERVRERAAQAGERRGVLGR